jgi:hypothetical protein
MEETHLSASLCPDASPRLDVIGETDWIINRHYSAGWVATPDKSSWSSSPDAPSGGSFCGVKSLSAPGTLYA